MRVLTWNCRRASAQHPLWDYLVELAPDVALLQEVGALPERLLASFDSRLATPRTKDGRPQRFSSALLARGRIGNPVSLSSSHDWVDEQLKCFEGNVLSFEVTLGAQERLTVVAVYSPAWPVSRSAYGKQDVAGVKLEQNPDVWVTDLVTFALRSHHQENGRPWVVAGDFNSCETFDSWKGGPRGNKEWLNRMAGLGFVECLRHHQGRLTPTFRGPGRKTASCQIDHLFVSQQLATRLIGCVTGAPDRVYGQQLSDHLPIISDFANS